MKKILSLIFISLLTVALLAGCAGNEPAPSNENGEEGNENTLTGTVAVVGSTSVTPVAQDLADAFMSKNPEVKIDVQGVGSTAGVKASNDGSADVGMASRNLKTAEKEWGLNEHIIAYDGIAVSAHPSNEVNDLTKEQVTKIFKGEITNWNEVGGIDREILVVSREAGSGTRGAFEDLMDLQEKNAEGKKLSVVKADALIADGNGAVKANVASKEYAIGYISLSYVDESVKAVNIDGVEATVENIKAEKYNVARPFLMLTKGEITPEAKAYLDFILSEEGQKIVGEKLITVN